MVLALISFADIEVNGGTIGGVATGGGLIALSAALIPVVKLFIEWRQKVQERKIVWEKQKRDEDAAAKKESADLFREMVTAITKGATHSESVEDILQKIQEKVEVIYRRVEREGWNSWKPPQAPKSGGKSAPPPDTDSKHD